jgi:hypothetical protein
MLALIRSCDGLSRVSRAAFVAVAALAGCGRVGFDPIDVPACSAQRAVYIVAGPGSLGWFTLVWPVPEVITAFQAGYAYDDVSVATQVVADPDHPLYARDGLWSEASLAQPSVILAGTNETHTVTPTTMIQVDGAVVIEAGVDAQVSLSAAIPALGFEVGATYVSDLVQVSDIDGAIVALRAAVPLTEAAEAALRPDAATLASWYGAGTSADIQELAERLLFTANAFRAGLVGTVLVHLQGDPHGAFDLGTATTDADALVGILRGFQAELADSIEPACRVDGAPTPLARNVVLVAFGDTPKNPFVASGWPDGTPGNSNWMYVRSNGFLRPGWFGEISTTNGRVGFDPASGLLDATATQQIDAAAADLAILYAITRGDAAAVAAFAAHPYQGLVNP